MKTSLRYGFLLLILTSLFMRSVRTSMADSTATTVDEYWALVRESRVEIARLRAEPVEAVNRGMEQLANRWELITEVEVNGGIIPVDHRYLVDMMRAIPPDLEPLDELLASLLEAQRTAPEDVFSRTDLAALNEILARPEFQWKEAASTPVSEWIQKILDTINLWLNRILDMTFDVAGSDVTSIILTVILAAILFFVFRTLFTDFMSEAELPAESGDEPLTSESAFAKAQELSRGGDYRAAVRYLYLSTLLILDERGVMRYDRSKTNREYLRSVSNSPELSKPLGEVIDVFDNVWYGRHSLEEESFKHYSDRVEELKERKA